MRHVGGGVSRQGAGHHDHWWVGSDRIGLLSHFLSAAGAAEALRPPPVFMTAFWMLTDADELADSTLTSGGPLVLIRRLSCSGRWSAHTASSRLLLWRHVRAAEGARAERRDEELWKPREPGMLSETSRHGLSLQ